MKIQDFSLFFILIELALPSWTHLFCSETHSVVFITSKIPQDSTAFFAQRIFVKDLITEHLTRPDLNITLLVLDQPDQGEIVFKASFKNITRKYFTPEMLYKRPEEVFIAQSAADFFPLYYQSNMFSVVPLIVTIDVQLPLSFFLMGGEYPMPKQATQTDWYIFYRVFQIFTTGQQKFRSRRRFSKRRSRNSVDEIDAVWFKDIDIFQTSFEKIFEDICRVVKVKPDALGKAKHKISSLGCNISECAMSVEVTKFRECKFVMQFMQMRWMLVISANLYEQSASKDVWSSLRKAKETCSKDGMSLLTINSQKEASDFSQYLRALREDTYLKRFPFKSRFVRFTIGLARRKGSAGRRFSWVTGKTLSYSYWDFMEPRGGDRLGCVHWKINNSNWADSSWVAAGCWDTPGVIFCHDELPPGKERLHITQDLSTKFTSQDGPSKLGEIYVNQYSDNPILTSKSLAAASGFLQQKLQEYPYLQLKGFVHGERLNAFNESNKDLIAQLNRLFYPCDSDDSIHGVPFSQVCDGVKDCSSGADESLCQEIGYPGCAPGEFSCASHQCVPPEAECDLLQDCQDASDEKDCDLDCPHRLCAAGRCLPKSWFNDGQVDCSDGSDERTVNVEPCVFTCNRTQCVTREMLYDDVIQCRGPEGPLDKILGALDAYNCSGSDGNSYINNWAPKCVLFHDSFGEIIGCRDFAHLADCQDFVCPTGYAKCPASFCIPIAYLNDGKQDCDQGQDESPQQLENSGNLFKCHPLRLQYVPLRSVCDGRKDCSQGEDELDCDSTCFPGFICLAGAISAARYSTKRAPTSWSFISPRTRYLDISGVKTPNFFKNYPKRNFRHLLFLNLSRCDINDILHSNRHSISCNNEKDVKDFQSVQNFDLSHNQVTNVSDCSIIRLMKRLKVLNLSHNKDLTYISTIAFVDLHHLKDLDLSFTGISKIFIHTFSVLRNLETIVLKQTRLTAIDFILPHKLVYFNIEQTNVQNVRKDVFATLAVSAKEIHSSSYKVCCPQVLGPRIPSHVCHFPADQAVFSCTDLVRESPLRVMLWLVGLAILLGNIVTLLYRLTWDRKLLLKPYGLFVTNLGVADILMGCYLMSIAIADSKFQGEYVFHDHPWKKSHACWAAGTMATVSSITSTLFIFLITVDRLLAVYYPFGDIRFNNWTMTAAVTGTWLFGISLASLPFLPFAQNWVIYSNSGMCLGLPLTSERLPGWQYSASLFVGLNFLLFLLIGFGQVAIYKKIKEKAKRTRKNLNPQSQLHQNQRVQEIAIAKQLSLVVISNSICWFPIISLGLVTLAGVDVGEAAYRWLAVIVLPINSALNPLLYTVPAIKKKVEELTEARKLAKALAKKTREPTISSALTPRKVWLRKVKRLRSVREELAQRGGIESRRASELKSLYLKVIDLRAACQ
ncbi:hypothetical protein RRG08_034692 [Elysia crispata]|uniref:G-protein coupled receptors family 1 profile domain-containing protein n=1 Tax=Elysia crispata TaxID=231223 RepID=A0AAE0Z1A6_9GAST|nr:hypothetical protein RRG08_034692 [Elysia crispata]